ncbi:MAG: ABC transporter ATP-binding protein [Solirubrobacterales bacterium]|nr:ABC transporter ATP-binding protein [Solirubrobacterales bacterium]
MEGLTTEFRRGTSRITAVNDVSFAVREGECVGLVGESGSGKSTTALSLIDLLPVGGRIAGGSVRLGGRELVAMPPVELRKVRGNEIGMIFQDPMSALNPTMPIGRQITEPLRLHRAVSRAQARARALELLELVGVPRPSERLGAFPHQLSGGLRQRVMIAIALACEPRVLIADEPTTALDVSIQAQILDLLEDLRAKLSMAILLITHDLGVAATRTDRIMVMYAGRIVERAPTSELFAEFRHPYAEALLEAVPRLDRDRGQELYSIPGQPPDLSMVPSGCAFRDRCRLARKDCAEQVPPLTGGSAGQPLGSRDPGAHQWACLHPVSPASASGAREPASGPVWTAASGGVRTPAAQARQEEILVLEAVSKSFPVATGGLRLRTSRLNAVVDVSLAVRRGETFALVGESGSGKTTLGRMAVALENPTEGRITWDGEDLGELPGRALRSRRRDLQMIYQDPYGSLDPRRTVGASIEEPLAIQRLGSRTERRERVRTLMDEVGLSPRAISAYPHEFSGGQRQRVGLARALSLNPRLIVADEPVSALDVSVQAQILNLMRRLQAHHSLTYVLISHDLSVVRYLADRIGVMYLGKLVELAPVDTLFTQPAHPYTHGLMQVIPRPDTAAPTPRAKILGELPSPISPPSGCRFRTRCPLAQDVCREVEPPLRSFGQGHLAACHFPLATPAEPDDGAGDSGRAGERSVPTR